MSAPQTTKPTIIGLYGISGSGKTYLLKKLKQDSSLKDHGFLFRDGPDLIDEVTPGGLEAFQQMERAEKDTQIELAFTALSADGQDRNKTAVIAGHYMFYDPESDDTTPRR
jgi:adenylylsulfate kinase-like enzyme